MKRFALPIVIACVGLGPVALSAAGKPSEPERLLKLGGGQQRDGMLRFQPVQMQADALEAAAREGASLSVPDPDGGTLSFTLAGPIAESQRLIVVDAAAMGAPPGTVRVFEGEAMDRQLSLHAKTVHEVSLADLFDIARLTDTLPAHRALVGIEPAVVDWGSELTPPVEAAVAEAMASPPEPVGDLFRDLVAEPALQATGEAAG
jgi:hydrogenase maturation protease